MEYNQDHLQHYGVKGMKWGVRRYRNEDGTLTSDGRKQARKEYRDDNSKAFTLGSNATVYGNAAAKSLNRTIKIENKLDKQYAKDPSGSKRRTQSLRKKWDASSKTSMELVDTYNKLHNAAKEHCDSLVKKYGKEAVADIRYAEKKLRNSEYGPKTFKTMNEDTATMAEWVGAGIANAASAAMMIFMDAPIGFFYAPTSTGQKAAGVEKASYRRNLKG
jgi:hypothetical protein